MVRGSRECPRFVVSSVSSSGVSGMGFIYQYCATEQ